MKKTTLTLGAITTAALPIVGAISCSDKTDWKKIVTIAINEKKWKPIYSKIIKDFKEDPKMKKLMADKGIDDIKIIKTSVDLKVLSSKGFRDESAVTDIFHFVGDATSKFLELGALAEFSKTTAEEFLDKYTIDMDYHVGAEGSKSNSKLYGVPQNIEAMIALKTSDADDNVKTLFNFSDLWMSVGFFNTGNIAEVGPIATKVNFKDIVKTTKENGKIVYGAIKDKLVDSADAKSEWETVVLNGFKKIVQKIKDANALSTTNLDLLAFDKEGSKAVPKIRDFFKANKRKSQLLEGPWSIAALNELFKGDDGKIPASDKIKAGEAPADWKQWGGGWNYGLNVRMTSNEKIIAENLISFFYKTKYVKELYEQTGKLSPINKSKEFFSTSNYISSASNIPKTIYKVSENNFEAPTDSAFSDVWGVYADAVMSEQNELSSDGIVVDTVAKRLKDKFFELLQVKIDAANAKITS